MALCLSSISELVEELSNRKMLRTHQKQSGCSCAFALERDDQTATHMDDDGLAGAASNIDLLGGGDVEVTQVSLELCVGGLQVEESLHTIKNICSRVSSRA